MNSVLEYIMIKDKDNSDKKCGTSNHAFEIQGGDAIESKCKEECEKNEKCVAFSADWKNWCTGCVTPLTESSTGAIAFRKSGIYFYIYKFQEHKNKSSFQIFLVTFRPIF